MRFKVGERSYDLIGREVFFGLIHVGTLSTECQPRTPEEAASAWLSTPTPLTSAQVIYISDYRNRTSKIRR